jgi:hypothetical protein
MRRRKAFKMKFWCGVFALMLAGCSAATVPVDPNVATGTVTVEVAIDDDVKVWSIDDVAAGATLEDVLRSTDDFPIEISGSGTTAFVNSIAGKSTSASEGWTYTIDGERAPAGIGSTTITPPTTVRWTFSGADGFFE